MKSRDRRQVVRNRRRTAAKAQLQPAGLANPPREALSMRAFDTAGLLMIEAARYLRYHDERCPTTVRNGVVVPTCRCADKALKFLRSKGVHLRLRGRTYLVRQDAIDRVLDGQPSDLDAVATAIARVDRSRRTSESPAAH